MKRIILESPFAGLAPGIKLLPGQTIVESNTTYLRACMRDALLRGESPFASHGLYTQPDVLNDENPEERKLGIAAGFEWRRTVELTVVYMDRGLSSGMKEGILHTIYLQQICDGKTLSQFIYRWLGEPWSSTLKDERAPCYETKWGQFGNRHCHLPSMHPASVKHEDYFLKEQW
jgi:hypothetical protein